MADTLTANYGWVIPADQASADTWGQKLNADLQAIDAQVWGNANSSNNLIAISSASVPATFSFYNSVAPSGEQLRWQWQMDTAAEGAGSPAWMGSNLNLVAYDNTGAIISPSPITISRWQSPSAAVAQFNNELRVQGPSAVSPPVLKFTYTNPANSTYQPNEFGHITAAYNSTANAGNIIISSGYPSSPTSAASLTLGPIGSQSQLASVTSSSPFIVSSADGSGSISASSTGLVVGFGTATLTLDNHANFTFGGAIAYKAGGGPWTAISDARVKTVESEYRSGLAEVIGLRPVTYHYNTGSDRSFIGLVAQEVEEIMPEMVTKGDGLIDGEKVNDLRTLDTTALIFALVNAVKELKAELDEVKALL